MLKNHVNLFLYLIFSLLAANAIAQSSGNDGHGSSYSGQQDSGSATLYYSSQSGQYSSFSGSGSKTTDKWESGSCTISTQGPIQYSLSPGDLSIGPGETKNWNGSVYPDPANAPAPGSSASARLIGDYEVDYKTGGIYDESTDTWTQDGHWENKTDQTGLDFMVYSLNLTLDPSPLQLCEGDDNATDIKATPYPEGAGSVTWKIEAEKNNITITPSSDGLTCSVKCSGQGDGKLTATYTVNGVAFSAVADVKPVKLEWKPNLANMPKGGQYEFSSIPGFDFNLESLLEDGHPPADKLTWVLEADGHPEIGVKPSTITLKPGDSHKVNTEDLRFKGLKFEIKVSCEGCKSISADMTVRVSQRGRDDGMVK